MCNAITHRFYHTYFFLTASFNAIRCHRDAVLYWTEHYMDFFKHSAQAGWCWQGTTVVMGRKTLLLAAHKKISTWTAMGSNPAHLVERPTRSYIDSRLVTNGLIKFSFVLMRVIEIKHCCSRVLTRPERCLQLICAVGSSLWSVFCSFYFTSLSD